RPRKERVVEFRTQPLATVVGVDAHALCPRFVGREEHALTDPRDLAAGVGNHRSLPVGVARDPFVIDIRNVIASFPVGPRLAGERRDGFVVVRAGLSKLDARVHGFPSTTAFSIGIERSVHSPASGVTIDSSTFSAFASTHISLTFAVPGRISSPSITPASKRSRPVSYTRSQTRPSMHWLVITIVVPSSVNSSIRGTQSE